MYTALKGIVADKKENGQGKKQIRKKYKDQYDLRMKPVRWQMKPVHFVLLFHKITP
jgi:hypothetical protein